MSEANHESARRKTFARITAEEEDEAYEARQRQIADHRAAAIAARRATPPRDTGDEGEPDAVRRPEPSAGPGAPPSRWS